MSTACLSGGQPVQLSSSLVCIDGFYCNCHHSFLKLTREKELIFLTGPNNNDEHLPQYCPPTAECHIIRFQEAHNVCNEPQGKYEPTVCRAGFYCPPGGSSQLICPKGHFCPLGSINPKKCLSISACPEGSSHQIYTVGFLCIILLDIIVLALATSSFQKRVGWLRMADILSAIPGRKRQPDPELERGSSGDYSRRKERLISRILMENNSAGSAFELSFQNISMRVKSSNTDVLFKQSGRILASTFLGVMGSSGSGKCEIMSRNSHHTPFSNSFHLIATLIGIIAGRIKPSSGHIHLNGCLAQPARYISILPFIDMSS